MNLSIMIITVDDAFVKMCFVMLKHIIYVCLCMYVCPNNRIYSEESSIYTCDVMLCKCSKSTTKKSMNKQTDYARKVTQTFIAKCQILQIDDNKAYNYCRRNSFLFAVTLWKKAKKKKRCFSSKFF